MDKQVWQVQIRWIGQSYWVDLGRPWFLSSNAYLWVRTQREFTGPDVDFRVIAVGVSE